jgi:type II secretory pathway pseudopilin PulG
VTPRRKGYTLLELVLVCLLITIVAALGLPYVLNMSGPYRMNAAVDSVRSAWAQARGRAIEEGRPYRFAVIPGTGYYRVAPDDNDFWSGSSSPAFDPHKPSLVLERALPRGVRFAVASGGQSAAAPSSGKEEGGGLDDGMTPPQPRPPSEYTSPIVFLPNGTAREDAEVRFSVRGAKEKTLSLRGLTGVVTVKSDKGGH